MTSFQNLVCQAGGGRIIVSFKYILPFLMELLSSASVTVITAPCVGSVPPIIMYDDVITVTEDFSKAVYDQNSSSKRISNTPLEYHETRKKDAAIPQGSP